ncbi:MAG: type VI secretion system tube protein Hcp [bacterium]|nr:type VI secretion system tube protein Hcp [bacterium]
MAYNMFLKVEGVDGDSTDAAHDKWIEVVSVNHGLSQEMIVPRDSSGEGHASGRRCQFRDFSVVKRLDRASVPLVSYCFNVQEIPEVTLEICRATGDKTTFMKIVLKRAFVASVSFTGSASADDPLPMEEVIFRYGEIEWAYTETSPSGTPGATLEAWYSVMENQPM